VVAAAAALADEVGWAQLTLAGLAGRLGVRLPSLYKHVDGLDGLRRGVTVVALHELGAALSQAAVARSGREALTSLAAAYREYATAHPGRYEATLRAPAAGDDEHEAAGDAVLRVVLAVLSGYGLDGADAVDATRVLRAGLHGFVSLERAGGFGMPQGVDHSFARLVDALHEALAGWAAARGRARVSR
jgi:AcrR family transcriptional regulator